MTSRIFRSISSVAIAVFLASLALIMGVLYDYFSGTQMTRLRSETELVADAVEISGVNYLRSLDATDDDLRITWIQPDGSVTYDNKADTNGMENHLEREEIKAALESGEGELALFYNAHRASAILRAPPRRRLGAPPVRIASQLVGAYSVYDIADTHGIRHCACALAAARISAVPPHRASAQRA